MLLCGKYWTPLVLLQTPFKGFIADLLNVQHAAKEDYCVCECVFLCLLSSSSRCKSFIIRNLLSAQLQVVACIYIVLLEFSSIVLLESLS